MALTLLREIDSNNTSTGLLDQELVKVGGRGRDVEFTLNDEVSMPELMSAIRKYLSYHGTWFSGSVVTVNVGRRLFNPVDVGLIRQILTAEFRIGISKFWCLDEVVDQLCDKQGIDQIDGTVEIPSRQSDPDNNKPPLMIKGNCRSGLGIDHDGDVVVVGDVNPGAEIKAAGDVVVLGVLRGTVHAGTRHTDFSDAVIVALSLVPLQLRIGLHYSIAPVAKKKKARGTCPEMAYVSDGSIVVEPVTDRIRRPKERNRLWQTIE